MGRLTGASRRMRAMSSHMCWVSAGSKGLKARSCPPSVGSEPVSVTGASSALELGVERRVHREAAVDVDDLAGDVRGGVAQQEGHGIGDVVRLAHAGGDVVPLEERD